MRLLWISTIAVLLILADRTSVLVTAQDPFGDGIADIPTNGSNDMQTPPSSAASDAQGELQDDIFERNAVVKSLLARPPKTHAELARAVQLMARVKRWEEVSRWMKAIEKLGVNVNAAAIMVDQVGGKTFQSLLGPSVEISQSEKDLSQRILELATQYRIHPKALANHVANMRNPERETRIAGFRGIQSAGYQGIAALLSDLMAANASQPSPVMCEALSKLEQPAMDAWKVAMRTPYADARLNLLKLAVGSKDPKYRRGLHAYFSEETIDANALALKDAWVNASGNNIASSAALEVSYDRLEALMLEYGKVRWEDDASTGMRWLLGADGRSVAAVQCTQAEQRWQSIVSEADNVILSGQPFKRDSALAIAIKIQHAESNRVSNEFPGPLSALLDRYEYACMVWDVAVKYDLSQAQLVMIQKLGRFVDPMPGTVRERLVAALDSGYSPVRYAAAAALIEYIKTAEANGNAQVSFRGRSKLDQVADEMSRLTFRPEVLLVGGSSSLRSHMRNLLEEFSFDVTEHANAANTLTACKRGTKIDVVCIVSQVLEMDLSQLVQRIRATPSGATAPIAILADSLSSQEMEFMRRDPRILMGSIPPEGEGLVEILRQVRIVTQSPTVDETSQILWKEQANEFRDQMKQRLITASNNTRTTVLADTPLKQKNLILRTLDKELGLPEREQASQIFVQSVRQFGLMVSSESADAQYDVYNERGPKEPETRILLGRILDAIEASRGNKDWSSVAP